MLQKAKQTAYSWLKWSEKFLKTDMIYVAKGGFWLSMGQTFSVFLVFISSIIMANFIPKEVYGNYKYILSATALLGTLSLSGIGNVITQAIAQKKDGTFFEAIRLNLRWGIIILSASLFVSFYYWHKGNNLLSLSMLIAGITMPITSAYGLYGCLLGGKKDFKNSTIWWSITSAINTSAIIITVLFTQSALAMVFAYFLSSLITTLYFYKKAVNKYKPDPEGETDLKLINYGKHMSLINFLGGVASQLDKILVFHFLGSAELAIYSFAVAIPEQIRGSYKNMFNLALPKYSEKSPSEIRGSIKDKILRLTKITFVLVILYAIIAPLIFNLIFPKYMESVFYSQIYIIGLITIPGISLFSTYFQVSKNKTVIYKTSIMGNIATIFLTYFLIKNFGVLGAVIEKGLSWFVILILSGYYFKKDKIVI